MTFLAACLAAAGSSGEAAGSIRHNGFEDFAKGTFGNSGANIYVSRNGRVQVINKWDFNRDGCVDILISADHNPLEVVDALIYWGSDRGYVSLMPELWRERPLAQVAFGLMDFGRGVTRLPAFGGGRSVIADLNRDGFEDVVFCNYIHNYPGVRTAYVYWGGKQGYDTKNRTELPTNWAAGVAAADLNGDGYSDLVFANQGVEAGLEDIRVNVGLDSYIYWGGPSGFSVSTRTSLTTRGAKDVAIADLNKDGYPDLAYINERREVADVQIFWGTDSGYSNDRSQSVPTSNPTRVRAGDVDGDGCCDLVVTTGQAEKGVCILLGNVSGIEPERMVNLPACRAEDSCISDFNTDGFVDVAIANASDGKTPLVPSFVYWGSKGGFSPERRCELPTLGAKGVASADLNADGYADLVFANSNDGTSYDVSSYIYWGSADGFAPYMRSDLQTFGCADVGVADMNADGKADLLFVNGLSGTIPGKENASRVFWGNPAHYYSAASMTSLPTYSSYDSAAADFDDDGFIDILLTNSASDESYIYWGSEDGFSAAYRSQLPVSRAFGINAADLNLDGYLDLVFTNTMSFTGRWVDEQVGTVLWGSRDGYSEKHKTILRLKNKRTPTNVIADLNRDGYLDLIYPDHWFGTWQIFWGGRDGYSESRSWAEFVSAGMPELADLNGDGRLDFIVPGAFDPERKSHDTKTRIFCGAPDGTPSPDGVVELEAYGALECGVADMNRDGYLDLVLSNYMSDRTRSLPLFVYWGGPNGYSEKNRTDLPAESSAGIQTIDLNRDGYPEIVVHNHLKQGDHSISSYVYWNGPSGFDKDRRTELPVFGPHFSQMVDPGNLYTRALEEEYISAPIKLPSGRRAQRISWKGESPCGSRLKFQVRSAGESDGLAKAKWSGPGGEGSFYETSGSEMLGLSPEDRWLQYRAVFTSVDGGEWPTLTQVEIDLR